MPHQFKLAYTDGCYTETAYGVNLTQLASGQLQHTPTGGVTYNVEGLTVYFIDDTTFKVTITGATESVIPWIASIEYSYLYRTQNADPDPNCPMSGGFTWAGTGNQLVLKFSPPTGETTGVWQLTDATPPVPLTVKVKRVTAAITLPNCVDWP